MSKNRNGAPLAVISLALLAAAKTLTEGSYAVKRKRIVTGSQRQLRYLSLFSGIGGFEKGIETVFPQAQCVAYCEICRDSAAIYTYHWPQHRNLGDIHTVNWETLPDFDLLVAGFPCTDLSNAASLRPEGKTGLKGKKSGPGLHTVIEAIWAKRPKYFILENVASMTYASRREITAILRNKLTGTGNITAMYDDLYLTKINSATTTGQSRSRLFWTNFPVTGGSRVAPLPEYPKKTRLRGKKMLPNAWEIQLPGGLSRFEEMLEPESAIQARRAQLQFSPRNKVFMRGLVRRKGQPPAPRWQMKTYSRTSRPWSATITASARRGPTSCGLMDERFRPPLERKFTLSEVQRLAGFPEGWTAKGLYRQYAPWGGVWPSFGASCELSQTMTRNPTAWAPGTTAWRRDNCVPLKNDLIYGQSLICPVSRSAQIHGLGNSVVPPVVVFLLESLMATVTPAVGAAK